MKKNKILLVSPRKAGTHLLIKILELFNIDFKGKVEIGSNEPGYYSIGSTFHTSFNNFFYKLDRETYDGGKLLPLKSSIGIIVSRHPLDILYSELNFSFKSDNTSYSNLLLEDDNDKINHIYNNAFYQNYFYELYNYCAWSKFDNFISVSFEEIIESATNKNLENLPGLKKLMEILNIKSFDLPEKKEVLNSPTFYKGEVNLGVKFFNQNFLNIKKDKYFKKYCEFYGYKENIAEVPTRLNILNNKNFNLKDNRPENKPITVRINFEDQNIVYYNKKLYSIPRNINFDEIKKFLIFLKSYKSYEAAKLDCLNKGIFKKIIFIIIKLACCFQNYLKNQKIQNLL